MASAAAPDGWTEAIDVINTIDSAKFNRFCTQLMLRMSADPSSEDLFTAEELAKMESPLGLESQQLKLAIECITFAIRKAAYNITKPPAFMQGLITLGMEKTRAEILSQIWSTNAKGMIDQLRQASVAPKKLEDTAWSLNLQLGSNRQTKQKIPLALFQFKLRDSSGNPENLTVEMDHSDLSKFYSQLEEIQSQLDSLR